MEAKRKGISLKDKYTMVISIKNGESQANVCKKFRLTKSTVSGIWKQREHIIKGYEGQNLQLMRLRTIQTCNINRKLYIWYKTRINANLPVNGKLLMKQAEEIARSLGENFISTPRWLDTFKSRHGILFKRRNSTDEDEEIFKHNFWPNVRAGYLDENIFTVREAGIFYKSFPDEKLDLCCNHGELASLRFTLCICANMIGTEKRRLLIVGNKRCNVQLPVKYKFNNKCWMNLELSLKELSAWNKELKSSNRKVLFLIKFSPAFRTLSDLSQIKIGYYSNDITTHPLDMAMAELKYFYRKYLLELQTTNISRLMSIRLLYKSWVKVSENTISNGFQILNGHCKEEKLSLLEWALKKGLKVSENIDECLTFDNNLVTSVHFLSDAAGIGKPLDTKEAEQSDEEETYEEISCDTALEMARNLSRYIETKGNQNLLECMVKVEHFIENTLDKILDMNRKNVRTKK